MIEYVVEYERNKEEVRERIKADGLDDLARKLYDRGAKEVFLVFTNAQVDNAIKKATEVWQFMSDLRGEHV